MADYDPAAYLVLSPSPPRARDDDGDGSSGPAGGAAPAPDAARAVKAARREGQMSPRGATPARDDDDAEPNPAVAKLEDELQCGMCSAVFIDPVALDGCGHVFCGSCVTLWLRALPPYPVSLLPGDPEPKPVSCPHCRFAPIKTAAPSRLAKTMVAVLLSVSPGSARTPGEIKQAQDAYSPAVNGGVIKFPTPPPPAKPLSTHEFWRPCKSCYPSDPNAWRCPVPVARADVAAERHLCLRTDSICPDGHRLCAGCNQLSPCDSPTSVSCVMCGEGYCGKLGATQCECKPVSACTPSPMWSPLHLAIEDCPNDMIAIVFRDNWTEVNNLVYYLDNQRNDAALATDAIYRTILDYIRSPECAAAGGLAKMLSSADLGLRLRVSMADDVQAALALVAQGGAAGKVCSGCIDELFIVGLLDWWSREMVKPEVRPKLSPGMRSRTNCKNGRKCLKQEKESHCRKYNHLCDPLPADQAAAIEQDDLQPAGETAGGAQQPQDAAPPPANAESDDDGISDEDDSDDDGKSYTDVGIQWGEVEGGRVVFVTGKSEADEQAVENGQSAVAEQAIQVDLPIENAPAIRVAELAASTAASGSRSPVRIASRPGSRASSPLPRLAHASVIRAASPSGLRRAATPPPLADMAGVNMLASPLGSPTATKFAASLGKLGSLQEFGPGSPLAAQADVQ